MQQSGNRSIPISAHSCAVFLRRLGVADCVRGVSVQRGTRSDPGLCLGGACPCRKTSICFPSEPVQMQYLANLCTLLCAPHPQADSPNPEKLPSEDVVGVTVVLLTCSFRSNEFVRVGYYVNNEYSDPELAENPPAKPVFEKVRSTTPAHPSQTPPLSFHCFQLQRNILASNPRVTKFKVNWD